MPCSAINVAYQCHHKHPALALACTQLACHTHLILTRLTLTHQAVFLWKISKLSWSGSSPTTTASGQSSLNISVENPALPPAQ